MNIHGLEKDKTVIYKVLQYLQTEHFSEYRKVISCIKSIEIKDNKNKSDNHIYPDNGKYIVYSGLLYGYPHIKEHVASLFIHEAHHVYQYKRGARNIKSRVEKGAYLKQIKFLKKVKCLRLIKHVINHYNETYTKGTQKKPLALPN